MPPLPLFGQLQPNYPVTPDYKSVIRDISPTLENEPAYQNTCVMRVSKALNCCKGHEIPRRTGLLTIKGKDDKRYAVRVREMKNYLHLRYAPPLVISASSTGEINGTTLTGKKGIVAFDVIGWGDASGHITLWNGEDLLYAGGHDYFNLYEKYNNGKVLRVVKCSFWQCP